MSNDDKKKPIELVLNGKISELNKPRTLKGGGEDGDVGCLIIERVENGHILRLLSDVPSDKENVLETILVFTNRDELFRELNRYL